MHLTEPNSTGKSIHTSTSLRRATTADVAEILALFVGTVRSTCVNDYTPEQIDVWALSAKNVDRWTAFVTDQHFLVAEIEGAIVGFGSVDKGNYVNLMYVHKDFLRRGIADTIFDALQEHALLMGFEQLTADVSITARPFFESKGLRVVKQNRKQENGIGITNYRMSQ
ncbi:MAG: GNAT family N-acetyltransferase [Ignavibacteria bacterium]|nr:GNAT family N-acetyltransferase [Ignavibacteria bacterium]